MCVIERKHYFHSNGKQETIEKTRPCSRAVGNRLCKHVEHRSFEAARIVEKKPSNEERKSSPSDKTPSDGYMVTEGSRGQQRMYRDSSNRSSIGSSIRRSATMSDRSPASSAPSSASSPSYVEVKPAAPSPPLAAPGFPFGERTRAPYGPPLAPTRRVTADGTAVYDRPPSMDQPRAFDNERPRSRQLDKDSSFSSTTAEVDDVDDPTLTQRRRQPSMSVDTTARPSTPSSGTYSAPGLSQLPRKSSIRRDSGRDVPRPSSRRKESDADRRARKKRDSAREEEEARQARLERDRLARSDQKQSAREQVAEHASRERHRRAAADALAGRRSPEEDSDDSIERHRQEELDQIAREREQAQQLKREDEMAREQRRRDDEARARYEATRPASPTAHRRHPSHPKTSSPLSTSRSPVSARAWVNPTTTMQPLPPQIHQQYPPPARRESYGMAQRGDDVIAREQARGASQRLNDAMDGLSMREREAEEYQGRSDEEGFRGSIHRRRGNGYGRYQ